MTIGMKELLLEEAETLVRTRGYAAFSYADLSARVGIRKASIHHHFATKEVLGEALVDGYLVRFKAALQDILDQKSHAAERLQSYAEFFSSSMTKGLLPLCGALSAEMSALPTSLQERVRGFFELHLAWLKSVVRAGIDAEDLRADLDANDAALLILSSLEGASLVAWATDDPKVITRAIDQVIASLE